LPRIANALNSLSMGNHPFRSGSEYREPTSYTTKPAGSKEPGS
jgi:hypothetical protein